MKWDEDTALKWCCFLDVSSFYSEMLTTPKDSGPQVHMESHGPENEKGLKFSNASFLYSKGTLGQDL